MINWLVYFSNRSVQYCNQELCPWADFIIKISTEDQKINTNLLLHPEYISNIYGRNKIRISSLLYNRTRKLTFFVLFEKKNSLKVVLNLYHFLQFKTKNFSMSLWFYYCSKVTKLGFTVVLKHRLWKSVILDNV